MKLIKFITTLFLVSGLTSAAYAAVLFQAGNIEEGNKWPISERSGVASYYADGKTGKVEFYCDLQGMGNNAYAMLRTGKNFDNKFNTPMTVLYQGVNGPFTWTLTDEKSDVGNIKVYFTSGLDVTIQCYGKKQ